MAAVAVALSVVGNRLWTDYQNRSPYGPEVVDARELLVRASARLVENWGVFEWGAALDDGAFAPTAVTKCQAQMSLFQHTE